MGKKITALEVVQLLDTVEKLTLKCENTNDEVKKFVIVQDEPIVFEAGGVYFGHNPDATGLSFDGTALFEIVEKETYVNLHIYLEGDYGTDEAYCIIAKALGDKANFHINETEVREV